MFRGVVLFVALLWAIFLADALLPGTLHSHGLVPRTIPGLVGVVTMPFLHGNLGHIAANTLPLFVLLLVLGATQRNPWPVAVEIAGVGGLLLWIFGRPGNHIGASLLIFGLIAFLVVAGFVQRKFLPVLASLGVAVLYGGTLLWGILPLGDAGISWDGHLAGAVAGAATAMVTPSKP